MTDGAADELYGLRNHYYVGNYQRAVHEGSLLSLSDAAVKVQRDVYVYRAYIAMGNADMVLDEIGDDDGVPTSIQATRLLAMYCSGSSTPDDVNVRFEALMNDVSCANNATLKTCAATAFSKQGMFKEAIRAVRGSHELEHQALLVQIYLRMNRPDVAEKTLRAMAQTDDDATMTLLATAWVHLAKGGAKFQEAAYIFQELMDKYDASVMLLNSIAVAYMHMGQYEEAEKELMNAIGKNPSDADTLVNLICCFRHTGKSAEVVQRKIKELQRAAPSHAWVKGYAEIESAFDASVEAVLASK
jgi:coatomer protein complex subunit epsilon|tara:strand:- start:2591 stop:3493 length:903 start_codon:yes stop_codon:yes gene_type:complete